MMNQGIKYALKFLFGAYEIYRVYCLKTGIDSVTVPRPGGYRFARVEKELIESSGDALVVEQSGYHGPESQAYACLDGPRIIGICFFWYGDRYRTRNFWPLAAREAKLVQVVTLPEKRGRGIAQALIVHASAEMFAQGFERLYARIWHSNLPSVNAFERAGWTGVATVIHINPLRRDKPWRITIRASPWAS